MIEKMIAPITVTFGANSRSKSSPSVLRIIFAVLTIAFIFPVPSYSVPPFGITRPANGSTVLAWSPLVSWIGQVDCSYSYDGDNYTSVNCSNAGSDIPAPALTGSATLYLQGIDGLGVHSYTHSDFNTWNERTSSGSLDWLSIASSADGTKLIAGPRDQKIRTSNDSGATWVVQESYVQQWIGIASSADGTKIAALGPTQDSVGLIFLSSDSGVSWSIADGASAHFFSAITSSASGSRLAAADSINSYIYTSIDSGANWIEQTGSGRRNWSSLASSADGKILVAGDSDGVNPGYLYRSTDGGITWSELTDLGQYTWSALALSGDGGRIAAASNGAILLSEDGGATWSAQNSAPERDWGWIASSYSGNRVAVNSASNGVPLSTTDYQDSWTQNTIAGSRDWKGLAYSADGRKLAAVTYGYIYTLFDPNADEAFASILTPLDGTTVGSGDFPPYILWGKAETCEYSYDGTTWNTVNCANNGSDIPAPNSDGSKTLHVRGTDNLSNVQTNTVDFTFDSVAPTISITSPVTNSTVGAWAPVVNWGNSTFCAYSFSQTTPFTPLTCSNNGSDIPHPDAFGNATLYIIGADAAGNRSLANVSFTTWYSPDSPQRRWGKMASSASGEKLIAPVSSGSIYTISGENFSEHTDDPPGERGWASSASSYDGTHLAAVDYGGYIYTSSNSGASWTTRFDGDPQNWSAIASSFDGSRLYATAYGYQIFSSSDGGVTWNDLTNSGIRSWTAITASANGRLVAATDGDSGYIYTSTDFGNSWTERTTSGQRDWIAITSSGDGMTLAAADSGGYIYTSTDGGANWTERTGAGQSSWRSIASSADGMNIIVAGSNVYRSTDGGANWVEQVSLGSSSWQSVTSSIDGRKLTAATDNSGVGGYIYFLNDQNRPELFGELISFGDDATLGSADFPPYVAWGKATYCTYAYDEDEPTVVDCSQNGADIPAPSGSGGHDLHLAASDADENSTTSSVTFTYDNSGPSVSIISPTNGAVLASWSPSVNWGDSTVCSYKFAADTVYIPVDCGQNGTDINLFWAVGSSALYVRGTDSFGNTTTTHADFTTWKVHEPSPVHWNSMALSADGTKLSAVAKPGKIYTSSDGGETISPINTDPPGTGDWDGIASSVDGIKLVAVRDDDYVYTSTNSGSSWTLRLFSGQRHWSGVASSYDGVNLVAVVTNGGIFTSTDSGATWNEQMNAGHKAWVAVASSADGTKLAATNAGGYIYTSTDSGVHWTEQTNSGQRVWTSITSSADGTKLAAAAAEGDRIYTSTDSGESWTAQLNSPVSAWYAIASSADGTNLIAIGEHVYRSTNGGVNWELQSVLPANSWFAVGSSIDGRKLAVGYTDGGDGGNIYTLTDTSVELLEAYPIYPLSNPTFTASTYAVYIYWGSPSSCSYSYDGESYHTVDCALHGSDIPPPDADGAATLYLLATDVDETTHSNQISFTYDAHGPTVEIVAPAENSTVHSWSPNVSWGDATYCEYSYDSMLYTPVDCESGGTDIPAPTLSGSVTLYIRARDAIGNQTTDSSPFTTWKVQTDSGLRDWIDIASSSDGVNLAAIVQGSGYIYTSSTGGLNWVEQTGSEQRNFTSVASSYDGAKLAATVNNGYIYTSTDYGANWTEHTSAGRRGWKRVVSSVDGDRLTAIDYGVMFGGYIYTSDDSGATWTERTDPGRRFWSALAASADGRTLVAGSENSGDVYISTDSGATWTPHTVANGFHGWTSITSSADGTKLAVADVYGSVYASTDSGNSWTDRSPAGTHTWHSIASSADGLVLIVTDDYGTGSGDYVYISSNGGAAWTQELIAGRRYWKSVATSADGRKIVAGNNGNGSSGYIYTFLDQDISKLIGYPLIPKTNQRIGPNTESMNVFWGDAITCSYSYDNDTFTDVSCLGSGTDIPGPGVDGTTTLYLRGTDLDEVVYSHQVTFISDGTAPNATILDPVNSSSISNWTPSVNWDDATTCAYSYNDEDYNLLDCSLDGADIPAPDGYGAASLYVKAMDAANNIRTLSVEFTFSEATPTPTASNSPTPTASNSPTPTESPTASNSPTPTASNSPTPTESPTASNSPTPTASASASPTPSDVPTDSPTPSPSSSPAPTESPDPTNALTPTPTMSPSPTPTPTASNSPTPTSSPSGVPTESPTSSATPTSSESPTPTSSSTPTESPTSTVTPTETPTAIPVTTPTQFVESSGTSIAGLISGSDGKRVVINCGALGTVQAGPDGAFTCPSATTGTTYLVSPEYTGYRFEPAYFNAEANVGVAAPLFVASVVNSDLNQCTAKEVAAKFVSIDKLVLKARNAARSLAVKAKAANPGKAAAIDTLLNKVEISYLASIADSPNLPELILSKCRAGAQCSKSKLSNAYKSHMSHIKALSSKVSAFGSQIQKLAPKLKGAGVKVSRLGATTFTKAASAMKKIPNKSYSCVEH